MKKHESIEVTIGPDGTVQVEAVGYKGNDCLAATKFIESALGLETKSKKFKPDYYSNLATTAKQKIGQ